MSKEGKIWGGPQSFFLVLPFDAKQTFVIWNMSKLRPWHVVRKNLLMRVQANKRELEGAS